VSEELRNKDGRSEEDATADPKEGQAILPEANDAPDNLRLFQKSLATIPTVRPASPMSNTMGTRPSPTARIQLPPR
jgi:hypothetical protein